MASEKHLRHAAAAEPVEHLVLASHDFAEPFLEICLCHGKSGRTVFYNSGWSIPS
jgi:hypothetical protein